MKRGQLQISFGMIFSIIIIIATLAIAAYVLVKFVNLGGNVSCNVLVGELQDRIDKAWAADGATAAIFTHDVPDKVTFLCFGNTTLQASAADAIRKEEVLFRSRASNNMFFYPATERPCGSSTTAFTLNHATFSRFFCVEVKEGKMNVRLTKQISEALVTLQP